MDQVLAQEVPHNEFLVEYGLKNLISVSLDGLLHGLWKYRSKNQEDGREEKLYSWAYMHTVKFSPVFFFFLFSVPSSCGTLTYYIGPLLSSGLYTC